ncbi:hypothetical protein R5R35_011664 [Gryllus longicercus]|uniref:C2H2-type domain-containing protein n=1 Tax=Gryllus longicercus TaxID=2509291 RepID=A0AAN9VPT9_9ORTH
MDPIQLVEIKQEPEEHVWNSQEDADDSHELESKNCSEGHDESRVISVDMSLKSEVKIEDHDVDGCGEDENGDVDEEIRPPEAVFIKQEVDWEEEEEDEEEGEASYPMNGEDFNEAKDGSIKLLDRTPSLKLEGPADKQRVCTCSNNVSNDESGDSTLINPGGTSSKHHPCKMCSSGKTSKVSGQKKNNRMYECSICHKRFKQRAYLAAHTRIHTGERPLQCHICLKDFTYRQGLYKHMLTHSEERPHSCSVCQKSFRKREHLVGHMRTHSEEAPYPCTNCEKSFKRKEHLLKHLRTHTEERPHHCSVCEKSFREKAVLLRHMELHTEGMYACSICKKIFRDFAKHMRFHSAEKACECPVCHLSFKVKELLNHLSTHTQGKDLNARTVSQEETI